MLAKLYESDLSERHHFGDHWCGPERYEPWQETLCAVYEAVSGGDAHKAEVYCCAAPARFYAVRALDWPNSEGTIRHGFEISFGSGQAEMAAKVAKMISEGMISCKQLSHQRLIHA